MSSMDLYDLYDMFADARSFAVIGNAGTILTYENGAKIDAYDVVVRFNCAYTAGAEEKVGTRTDILCANAFRTLDHCASPSETLRPRCVVNFANKSPRDGEFDRRRFAEWAGAVPTLFTWAPDLIGVPQGLRTRPLTQGTYLLFTLLRLFRVERLFVTGFTFYRPVAGTRLKYFEGGIGDMGISHELDEEAVIFAHILNSFDGELEVTPEVAEVLGRQDKTTVKRGLLAGPKAAADLNTVEWLKGWLSWKLIRSGVALRRSVEQHKTIDFDRYKRRKRKKEEPA